MPKSKSSALRQQLAAAEEEIAQKTKNLAELKEQASQARLRIEQLEGEAFTNDALDDDVQTLLRHQRETAAEFKDYENRVLALELQGLVERWRVMDIEELAQQNHELREECMRLQAENMDLSRALADSSLSARRDLAKIELALEMTVKEKMREMHSRLRRELYEEMDEKTKAMVAAHGLLQEHVADVAGQAGALDEQYRALQRERGKLKVDADVATSLGEQQAVQAVALRRQLRAAYQAIELLRRRLADSEAAAGAAWDEALRAGSRAALAAAAATRAELGLAGAGGRDVDADSAYGTAGDAAELAALESQLRHARQRAERLRVQRDRWRDRSLLYERACAQLQAALATLQEGAAGPGGAPTQRELDAIWCAVKAEAAGAGQEQGAVRPVTPGSGFGSAASMDSAYQGREVGSAGVKGGGGGGSPTKGRCSAGAKGRAASARSAGGAAGSAAGDAAADGLLRARPHTATAAGSGSAAARRAADAIRMSVAHPGLGQGAAQQAGRRTPQPPACRVGGDAGQGVALESSPSAASAAAAWAEELADEEAYPGLPAAPGPAAQGQRRGPSPDGGGEGMRAHDQREEAGARPGTAAAASSSAAGSPPRRPPPPLSRLYSGEPEAFRAVRQLHYDQPGWPVTTDLRPLTPTSPTRGGEGAGPCPPPRPGPLAALAPSPGPRRPPGSLRSHEPPARVPRPLASGPSAASAVSLLPPAPSQQWSLARSLTGLTARHSTAADAGGGSRAGGDPGHAGAGAAQAQAPSGGRSVDGRSRSPSPRRGAAGAAATAAEAADVDRQCWAAQRARSQSPEYAAMARGTASGAGAAAGGPAAGIVGVRISAGGEPPGASFGEGGGGEAAAAQGAHPVSRSTAGALYMAAAVSGGAGVSVASAEAAAEQQLATGGGPLPGPGPAGSTTSGPAGAAPLAPAGLLPPAAAAYSASRAAALGAAAGGSGTGAGLGAVASPAGVLAALRRPPSAIQRLSSADVMFSGGRLSLAAKINPNGRKGL